jgi:DNA (cytosine-5)-methyltransferase 1
MLLPGEITVDSFAGGGGASEGIEGALGRPIDIAINHDPEAIAMHMANHPRTKHYCEDMWQVDPIEATRGRPVGLAWFSPDCKHFSRAKGGKPVSKRVRGLAWVVIRWAKAVRPRVIMLENVSEFATWGPLLEDGSPCKIRKGFTFRRWHKMLENLGYQIDMREMSACDYGAPTTRRRLFIIARCDGQPIVWPQETHGRGLLPYRTAAECIDWSIPCPSIFERSRPLADATLRRIARGITRYVVNNPKPFIVTMRGTEGSQIDCSARPMDAPLGTVSAGGIHHALVTPLIASLAHGDSGGRREYPIDDPLGTVSAGGIQHALVSPVIARIGQTGGNGKYANDIGDPLTTITTKAEHLLIAPTLINTRNGEREGQAPRVRDILDPAPTVTAKGSQGALVAAFLARHYGGHENDGAPMTDPMFTVTAKDHHSLVYAFLMAYYGTDQNPRLELPLGTVTSKDRFGLVTVMGDKYYIADIGMRMLVPRELFNAQSFPPHYIIDPIVNGKPLTKTAQVRMAGNSVCRVMAKALVLANVAQRAEVMEVA